MNGFDWYKYAVGGAAARPDSFSRLNPDYAARVAQLIQAADAELGPGSLKITSAYRSPELQAQLYQNAIRKYGSEKAARKWVAPPGRSKHNFGMAVDFANSSGSMLRDPNSKEARWIKANAGRFGLDVPMSWEPWQVELAGSRGGKAVANDTMKALGREPMKQQAAQTMQVSSQSAPMGLLGAVQPEEPGGLLGLLGKSPKWASKANDIGAVLLALSGSPAAAPLMQQVRDRKKDKREAERINQTVQWLANNGRTDLAEAVAAGTLGGSDAARILLTPPDPMENLRIQQAQLGLEKTRLELAQLQQGASEDPSVQSSAQLPDQSGVLLTMRDGSVTVKTVGGDTITGQDAIDYVRTAQERAAEFQRSIYGARREGTLGADVALGEPAAAASARGTEIGKAQGAAITGESGAVAKAQSAIDLIEQIKTDPALPSVTGMIQGRLPPLSQEGTNLDVKIRQLKGKAFLEAFESLKGGGAITEAEGRAATEAMARLDRAQDEQSYIAALTELQAIMQMGLDRAKSGAARARGQGGQSSPGRLRFNPDTGDFE